MTNNLVVLENRSIANKQMNVQLKKVVNGLEKVERGTWEYAIAVHQIITKELYNDDFENLEDFASFIGTSKSYVSKMVNAVEFALNNDVVGKYSVSKCYLLSTIKNYDNFQEYCKDNKISIDTLSKADTEKTISLYNNRNANAIRDEKDEEDETEYVQITYNRKKYNIPIKVLNKYVVE